MLIQMKCRAQHEAVRFQRSTCRLKERDALFDETLRQKGEDQVAEMRAGWGYVAV
ncbi:hypothetical protein HU200_004175 [Digitaria exilis]|uniref:Uncharacterized protein n=1 Tax=Digitaria exilis TaxID=1010633 RepID=A0A835FTQ7_9POAL|nr:hypothetical protein HU200_004175 [Digitaria exilis]